MNNMNNNLTYSGVGLTLTENSEGCFLTPYQDSNGVWTNGFGNTHHVIPGRTITMDEAISDLKCNLQSAENTVKSLVSVILTQGEFDALVDLVFNIGAGNFSRSTLLKKLNSGEYSAASIQFPAWDEAGGHVLKGLLTRRIAEQHEFDQ